mmetsp:Transcript_12146/g.36611  ORF Transcript_12146/g.36611 Transcript_12146/m.36611 type:complete len:203 (+) Transcript_12146:117-725(+)
MAAQLFVKRLSDKAVLPAKGSELSAGWDLAAAEASVVPARGKALVKTDLAIATPEDCYARIAPRSGLAWKKSIDVGAGVVDADYRGNVGVILFNFSDEDFQVHAGDRVAQLILEKVHLDATLTEVQELPETTRGAGGFGSTGVSAEAPAAKKQRAVSPPLPTSLEQLRSDHERLLRDYKCLRDKLQAIEDQLNKVIVDASQQ